MIKKLLPIIFFLFLISCSSENENKTSEIELSGEKVKIMNPSTGIDTAGGKISPTIRYKLPDDEIYVTYPENNPTIILFVAHWCPYCQEEIPEVIRWIEEDGVLEKGLSVLLVVTSTDPSKPNYPPKDWLYNEKWQYPVIYDDSNNSIANYFGVQYFPSWVFTEGDKSIAMTYAGKISKEELSKLIN